MEPLNSAARSKAFTSFLIFFIITTALVIAAVFFSIQVPFQQNKQLTEQMKVVEGERLFTQKFESNMNEVMRLLDSLNNKEVNITLIDGKIEEKLKSMNALIDSDSSLVADPSSSAANDLYSNVVTSLGQYHNAKKEIRQAANKEDNVSDYKQQIAELKNELNSTKQTLNLYQIQLANRSNQ